MLELSGRELAAALRKEAAARAAALAAAGTQPRLAIVLAADPEGDSPSLWYVRSISRAAAKAGITAETVGLGETATPDEIRAALRRLNADPAVHGIILQTPLPDGADPAQLAEEIDPAKDVDGANPRSLGLLAAGRPAFAPATAEAVLALLDHHRIDLAGRRAVVVGRSTVVGKPVAHLLLDRNATVTVCHSRTRDLPAVTRGGEIVVAAVGRAHLLTGEHLAAGAVVVDVGTNTTVDGGLAGDVDPESAASTAGALSPVPGGVGPVTTALLLMHTVRAAEHGADAPA
ncbi:bifunctional 5,10-methylene-tetrahydrofolate dehydrogenase/5,10-methylene-tetrahydrofolate cyclohydrolase [Mangrovactinospora gilvigrisea]|uniref:Bifunctional protein FolD n=1 Tax=Mangrovactinospora gilvigrisea TaxID=1428644 RepID=A0A1J7C705_9ACTN|nr:bifunctional 5,10-methylenetetrahydrofolate dehydrogenase/5,10-methenyltetrahydrofolate cyclohydrolase [Mangrovactinospora gilvigrisea]OIV37336.1 bifunctional 5,10-methylene-tetrahydrofolate dehydrogenase/5,10-methylene-tetrahydrofolate cyclohydrolase [Mangrovactinospora gilvigrisea]